MEKYSAGPWESVLDELQNVFFIRDPKGRIIAEVEPQKFERGTTKANADLLAAAPELLSACKFLLLDTEPEVIAGGAEKFIQIARIVLRAEGRANAEK